MARWLCAAVLIPVMRAVPQRIDAGQNPSDCVRRSWNLLRLRGEACPIPGGGFGEFVPDVVVTRHGSDVPHSPGTAFLVGGERRRALGAVQARKQRLSAAGDLLFGGTQEGNFFALDAESGKALWDVQLGGAVRGVPISYAVDGKQYADHLGG